MGGATDAMSILNYNVWLVCNALKVHAYCLEYIQSAMQRDEQLANYSLETIIQQETYESSHLAYQTVLYTHVQWGKYVFDPLLIF